MNLKTSSMSIYKSLENRINSASTMHSLECTDASVANMYKTQHITKEEFVKLDTLIANRMDELSKESV